MSHHDETTSRPRRLGWLLLGFAAGAATAHFADPDRGATRRSQVRDQVTSLVGDVSDEAATAADHATNRARGAVAETRRTVTPQDVPADPDVLRQRVRSVAFGHHDDTDDVVLIVDAPGEVTLRGTVHSETSRDTLLAAVRDVDGVRAVSSELAVSA